MCTAECGLALSMSLLFFYCTGIPDSRNMTEHFIIEESSADIYLFTMNNEITMDYHDTFTLKFTPEYPELFEEKEGEFIRHTAIVNIIDNTCKRLPHKIDSYLLMFHAARNHYPPIVR